MKRHPIMNIVLTNDDGIDSAGLVKLAEALTAQERHHIYVCAPDRERSGASHSLSFLREPLKLVQRAQNVWSCSGTPADCALAAVLGGLPVQSETPFKPDVIVSGINVGANLGTDIIYSGTAAAARQAALMGLPGIALSLTGLGSPWHWDQAAAYAAEHLEEFIGMCDRDIFINVNIPNTEGGPSGMAITFPSLRQYHDGLASFKAPGGHTWCFLDGGVVETEPESGSDWDAVSRNLVSVSPVFSHPVVRRDLCTGAPDHAGVAGRPQTLGSGTVMEKG
jgi:5'-nucleotidase